MGELDVPALHMSPVSLSAHPSRRNIIPLPPTGVFDWHYLQCVMLRFATDQYRQLRDITFFTYPFTKPLMMSRLKMLSMMNLRILRIALTDSWHFNGKNIRNEENIKT